MTMLGKRAIAMPGTVRDVHRMTRATEQRSRGGPIERRWRLWLRECLPVAGGGVAVTTSLWHPRRWVRVVVATTSLGRSPEAGQAGTWRHEGQERREWRGEGRRSPPKKQPHRSIGGQDTPRADIA